MDCIDLLPLNGSKTPVTEILSHQVFFIYGSNDITCREASKHCREASTRGGTARLVCPESCGCHLPTRSITFSDGAFGCPMSCTYHKMYQDTLWKSDCADVQGAQFKKMARKTALELQMFSKIPWKRMWLGLDKLHYIAPRLIEDLHSSVACSSDNVVNWTSSELCVLENWDLWRMRCPITCQCTVAWRFGCPGQCLTTKRIPMSLNNSTSSIPFS